MVVQRIDNITQEIGHYPVDTVICSLNNWGLVRGGRQNPGGGGVGDSHIKVTGVIVGNFEKDP